MNKLDANLVDTPLVQSVRVDPWTLEQILNRRDNLPPDGPDERRAAPRLSYRASNAVVQLLDDSGSTAFVVPTRNLSCGGLAFFHSQMIHMGTQCWVCLPSGKDGWTRLKGTVVRCQHVAGMVHEIGLQFVQP